MMTHILVRWRGTKQKCRGGENALLHVGGWERDFDISEHSGSCDLNPKKEIQRVWRRESFGLAVKLTVKTHMDSGLKPHWKLGAIKCKWEVKNQFGLTGSPTQPISRPQVVNKANRS